MGLKSLASGRTKLAILAVKPADMKAPTVTELTAGIDASCRIAASDYALGPVDSETISDPALCDDIDVKTFGNSNFEGTMAVFRYFNATGGADTTTSTDLTGDQVYQALKTKGSVVYLVERRTSKKSKEAWAVDDEVRVYAVETDNPQPGATTEGYIKVKIPLNVTDAEIDAKVAGAAA